ncbi:MAG TPA: carbohydrate-binding protein [Firmicutes bacterium]|nr:carbohydrate-binding protein [Bacillota bacterium]
MGLVKRMQKALRFNPQNNYEFGALADYRVSVSSDLNRSVDSFRIKYQGLLKESGANEVFLHYGFDGWKTPGKTVKMEKEEDGSFGVDVYFEGEREINFCFKDPAGNWDTNNGQNWNINVL